MNAAFWWGKSLRGIKPWHGGCCAWAARAAPGTIRRQRAAGTAAGILCVPAGRARSKASKKLAGAVSTPNRGSHVKLSSARPRRAVQAEGRAVGWEPVPPTRRAVRLCAAPLIPSQQRGKTPGQFTQAPAFHSGGVSRRPPFHRAAAILRLSRAFAHKNEPRQRCGEIRRISAAELAQEARRRRSAKTLR